MAYMVSPTPVVGPSLEGSLASRPVTRSATYARNQALRPAMKRPSLAPSGDANSKRNSLSATTRASSAKKLLSQQENKENVAPTAAGDSSDDDDYNGPAPALSAAAEMLLRTQDRQDAGSRVSSSRNGESVPGSGNNAWEYHSGSPKRRADSSSALRVPATRTARNEKEIAAALGTGSPSPRVVRLNRNSPVVSGLRRSVSASEVESPVPVKRVSAAIGSDLKTPANARPRSALASSVNHSSDRYKSGASSGALASSSKPASADASGLEGSVAIAATTNTMGPATISRQNASRTEDRALHNSIRVKRTERVGGFTGNFLKGPARRGVVRRQSDDQSPVRDQEEGADGHNHERNDHYDIGQAEHSPLRKASENPRMSQVRFTDMYKDAAYEASAKVGSPLKDVQIMSDAVAKDMVAKPQPVPAISTSIKEDNEVKGYPITFKIPPPLPSQMDQENDPPPTFKRNKPDSAVLGSRKTALLSVEKLAATGSPARQPLAPRSHNTPLRPAPPPPKMSVLETATVAAGATSVAQAKKKRNYVSVNNKLFTRMECVGRGGSGRVYRVMAENFKVFALKRVSLEDVDEMSIRGFKGEIDLLRKLSDLDRVVRLYDYEINEEKKTLSVLMEFGELDLKNVLHPYLDAETGRLDLTFVRRTWQEMLECVRDIHERDVVHSDLKPANFVLMQGRLKLIDFGIANAIQDDTVNVHREHQVGTPNYMAPEAIVDTNAGRPRVNGVAKLVKLGKPSDVWSLGCILYQMVYGTLPFAHISNTLSKAMAITDSSYAIAFPELGVGKVPVPWGLLRTMRRCLNRNLAQRPTIEQLLDKRDPFLYPDAPGTIPINQEIVRRLQENVLKIIEAKGMPAADANRSREVVVKEWLDEWSPQLFASIKASMEKGTA